MLNIRELPGHKTAKVGALGPTTSGLRPTGACPHGRHWRLVGAGYKRDGGVGELKVPHGELSSTNEGQL